jgi:hypothetical protein
MFTLAQAQAGILTQLDYLRGHLAPATPPEVAGPVRDFIAATSDVIAADGQHQPAPLTNAAAKRFKHCGSKYSGGMRGVAVDGRAPKTVVLQYNSLPSLTDKVF